MNWQHNPTLAKGLFITSWALTWVLSLVVSLTIILPFFRQTLGLPFIMADMFSGLFLGWLLGSAQWLAMRLFTRRPVNRWIWFSSIGGLLGGLVGGLLNVWLITLALNAPLGIVPVAGFISMIGIMQWSALVETANQTWRWAILHLIGGLLLQTFGVASATPLWLLLVLGFGGLSAAGFTRLRTQHKRAERDTSRYQRALTRLYDQPEIVQSSHQHPHQHPMSATR